eukprot:5625925-Amphidinium_carterae.1
MTLARLKSATFSSEVLRTNALSTRPQGLWSHHDSITSMKKTTKESNTVETSCPVHLQSILCEVV